MIKTPRVRKQRRKTPERQSLELIINWRLVDLWDFLFVFLHLNKLYFMGELKDENVLKKITPCAVTVST